VPRSPAKPQAAAIAALLGLVVIWGLSIPLTKLALVSIPPLTLTALRYLVAAPFFALVLLGRPLPARRVLWKMALLGLLGMGVGQEMQVLAVQRVSASVATLISASIPILTVILATWRLGQRIRPWHALGLATALGGIFLVAYVPDTGGPDAQARDLAASILAGDAMALVSPVAVAGYYVFSAELAIAEGVVPVAAWGSLFGTLVLLPGAAWEMATRHIAPSLTAWAVVLYLGLLVTVLGIWVWLRALQTLPARIAASSQYLQPLIGIAASAVLFGDTLGSRFAGGTALVFVGIGLSAFTRRRRTVR
jgi:O-acetylserine/cysteine efflux transporter